MISRISAFDHPKINQPNASRPMPNSLKCPFCLHLIPTPKPGPTTCPACSAEFEIDDRLECVFVDPAKLRLPVNGTVCLVCGLVQDDQVERCVYCRQTVEEGLANQLHSFANLLIMPLNASMYLKIAGSDRRSVIGPRSNYGIILSISLAWT